MSHNNELELSKIRVENVQLKARVSELEKQRAHSEALRARVIIDYDAQRSRVAVLEGRTTNCPACGKAQVGRLKVMRSRPPSARCQHCAVVSRTRSRGVDMLKPDQSEEGELNDG